MREQRLAYLVSQYPAVSHTFILREIVQLRRQGFEICVASINDIDLPWEKQGKEEKEEILRAFYIKKQGALKALSALFLAFFHHPLRFFRALRFSASLEGWDLKRQIYGFFYLAEAALLGRWMQEKRLSHAHAHFANPAATVALLACQLYPFSYSITTHGPDEFDRADLYRLPQKIQHARFVCCIGYYAKSQLMRLSPPELWSKFFLAPLGIDPSVFAPDPSRQPSAPVTILCVGRLTPAKGQHILLQAFQLLLEQGKNVRLILVGDGPDRLSLEKQAEKAAIGSFISFLGKLNQQQTLAVYRQADIFALASFAEGIPVSLMEAMALEIPCVASWVNGIPELIRHGIDGWLTAPADPLELADALKKLLDNPSLRESLGKQGRKRVIEKYSLLANTANLGRIFKENLFT